MEKKVTFVGDNWVFWAANFLHHIAFYVYGLRGFKTRMLKGATKRIVVLRRFPPVCLSDMACMHVIGFFLYSPYPEKLRRFESQSHPKMTKK